MKLFFACIFIFLNLKMTFARSIFQVPSAYSNEAVDTPSASRDLRIFKSYGRSENKLIFKSLSNKKNAIQYKTYKIDVIGEKNLTLNLDFNLIKLKKNGAQIFEKFSPEIEIFNGKWSENKEVLLATKISHHEKIFTEIEEVQRNVSNKFGVSITRKYENKLNAIIAYEIDLKKMDNFDVPNMPAKVNSTSSKISTGIGYEDKCTIDSCPFTSELVLKYFRESEKTYLANYNHKEIYFDYFTGRYDNNFLFGLGVTNSLLFYDKNKNFKYFDFGAHVKKYLLRTGSIEFHYNLTFKPSDEIALSQYYIKKKTKGVKIYIGYYPALAIGFSFEDIAINNQKNLDVTDEQRLSFSFNMFM